MLLSISIPMKFLDLLRFIDFIKGVLISEMLSYFYDWDSEDHKQDCETTRQNAMTYSLTFISPS